MNQPAIVAPATPPRGLWLAALVVLALHLLALLGLPLPVARPGTAAPMALDTRVLPPPAPVSTPAAPPAAAPNAHQRKARHPPARRPPAHASAPASAQPSMAAAAATASAPQTDPAQQAIESLAQVQAEEWLAQLAAPAASPPAPDVAPATTPKSSSADGREDAGPTSGATAEPSAPLEAATPATTPLVFPPSTRLSFDVQGHVKGFDYSARAELLWQTDGGRYLVCQKISAFLLGSRAQESSGSVGARGLRPERFVDAARKERSVELDFAAHAARFSDGVSASAPIGDGAQDRLSVFVQLGAQLAADPGKRASGTRIAFETVGARRVDRWVFRVDGPEQLQLPVGTVAALKLQRLAQDGDEQTDELWLGTDLGYLPVRIRLAQGRGDYVDLRLSGHDSP